MRLTFLCTQIRVLDGGSYGIQDEVVFRGDALRFFQPYTCSRPFSVPDRQQGKRRQRCSERKRVADFVGERERLPTSLERLLGIAQPPQDRSQIGQTKDA